MHVHWEHKKRRSGGMSNAQIDEWYDLASSNGALGGKLVGAGGGGFLMFYAEDRAGCARRWRRPGWRKCAFASISKAPRSFCPEDAAGRHTRRWSGHAAASADRADAEGAAAIAGRPFCHQLDLLRSRASSAWCCASVISASRSKRRGRWPRLRHGRFAYSFDGAMLLGTGGALQAGAAVAGRRVLCPVRRFVSALLLRAVQSAYSRQRAARPDDRFRNEDRWDTSNVLFSDGGSIDTTNSSPRRICAISTYGLRCSRARALARVPPTPHSIWPTSTGDCRCAASSRPSRSPSAFTRSAPSQGIADTERITCAARSAVHELRTTATCRRPRRSCAGWIDDGDREHGRRCWRRSRRRRPAFLPGRRRQRRELLARGERFSQDRRHRVLCADRQCRRADRAHQRRGLGKRLRRVAEGQPAHRPRTPCSSCRSAAATLEKNISPNLVVRHEARQARSAPK